MKLNYWPAALLLTIVVSSCKRSPVSEEALKARVSEPCGKSVVANATDFGTAASDPFSLMDAVITGDCLTVKLALATGCADPQILRVLHAPVDAAVYPPSHALKIVLTYGVGCTMPEIRTYNFDLYPIRQKNTNKMSVTISGQRETAKTLQYVYE